MKMMRMVMAEVVVMMVKHCEKRLWQKWKKVHFDRKKGKNDGDEYDQQWDMKKMVAGQRIQRNITVHGAAHTRTHTTNTQTYMLILVLLS